MARAHLIQRLRDTSPLALVPMRTFLPVGPPTVIILGAGFSHVAGLPLAKDLFDAEMFTSSKAAERRFSAVLQNWRA
jgi:hypothetical protein